MQTHSTKNLPVARGINDGDVVVLSLELPEGNIDGDTTFTLGLELVQHPGVLEGALAHLKKGNRGWREDIIAFDTVGRNNYRIM